MSGNDLQNLPRMASFRVARPRLFGGVPVMLWLYACLLLAALGSPLGQWAAETIPVELLALFSVSLIGVPFLLLRRGVPVSSRGMMIAGEADALQRFLALWRERARQEGESPRAFFYLPPRHPEPDPRAQALEAMGHDMGFETKVRSPRGGFFDRVSVYIPTAAEEDPADGPAIHRPQGVTFPWLPDVEN